jgi:hypothetical protein
LGGALRPLPGTWGALMAAGSRALPPGRGPELRPTGAAIVAATRTSTLSSTAALARRFADRKRLHVEGPELARPVDDGWRSRYLAAL